MINPTNPISQQQASPRIKTSIFYINDIHGQIPKMEQIASASLQFDTFTKNKGVDTLKLSSGDTFIGGDEKTNQAAATFLDTIGIMASTLGNHEFDVTATKLYDIIKNKKTKFLAMNTNFTEKDKLKDNTLRSTIVEENGNKYGLIGLQPVDLATRTKPECLNGITTDNEEQTMKELQEEVNNLTKQGVNKIILLSHTGYEYEKQIAQKITGIDVILGGHSHDLLEGVKEGTNLFYAPDGKPVVITQAGRDGHNFGILNLEYSPDGTVVSVQNNVQHTSAYSKNLIMTLINNKILGESPTIGRISYADPYPQKPLIEENPYANFVADAVRKQMDSDIVLINSANFRGNIEPGIITERDVTSIFPFKNKLCRVKITEKALVDALNWGGTSLKTPDNKPNILQVSGLTYTLSKEGKVTEASFYDKQGQKHQIDVNNPSTTKMYDAVYDDFIIKGGDKFDMLKFAEGTYQKFDFDKDKATIEYIKKLGGAPFEIKKDGRIKFE